MKERLKLIQNLIKQEKLDAYYLGTGDKYCSEYTPEKEQRIKWLTGFTGSKANIIILKDRVIFFTDGRYTLQATGELDDDYEIINFKDQKPEDWLAENEDVKIVGYDPWLVKCIAMEYFKKNSPKTNFKKVDDLVDRIWLDKNGLFDDFVKECFDKTKIKQTVKLHDIKYTGKSAIEKCKEIVRKIKGKKADAVLIGHPESINWLLNIRGDDVSCTPVAHCFAVLYKDLSVDLIIDKEKISDKVISGLRSSVDVNVFETLKEIKGKLKDKKVLFDKYNSCEKLLDYLDESKIIYSCDPCSLPKACKNQTEINGTIEAHVHDGVALTKFIYWLNQNVEDGKVTEASAAKKVYDLRKQGPLFQGTSFGTISAFGDNGAFVHYDYKENKDVQIKDNNLYLVDSGGQYLNGTTDVTRTLSFGDPTKFQKRNYTLVLKGLIAVSNSIFDKGTLDDDMDKKARQALNEHGLDYDHGSGHGVGSYLGVHEGPQSMGKRRANNVPLREGMIMSIEPGFYKENKYGIRIENLIYVKKFGHRIYGFETLTLAPFCRRLIDKSFLNEEEINWINEYQADVLLEMVPWLEDEELKWLKKETKPL